MDLPEELKRLLARLVLAPCAAYDPKWSAAPDFLGLIADHALTARPKVIVECSSGVTTLILARCCALNGSGHVFSLENGPEFAARTRAELERFGLSGLATVIDAPLVPCPLDGREYQWYNLAGLPPLEVDMLVIDGPPGFIQRHSRYPALPRLASRMTTGGVAFLDDAARPDERELVAMWLVHMPALRHDYIANERGCSILGF